MMSQKQGQDGRSDGSGPDNALFSSAMILYHINNLYSPPIHKLLMEGACQGAVFPVAHKPHR
jgi:hypothetical protein